MTSNNLIQAGCRVQSSAVGRQRNGNVPCEAVARGVVAPHGLAAVVGWGSLEVALKPYPGL